MVVVNIILSTKVANICKLCKRYAYFLLYSFTALGVQFWKKRITFSLL